MKLSTIILSTLLATALPQTISAQGIFNEMLFAKDKTVDILSIDRIDRINRLRLLGKPLITYLIIVMTDGTEHCVMPKNEEDFIKCIAQRRTQKEKQALDDCND